jgi:hypothetical protein
MLDADVAGPGGRIVSVDDSLISRRIGEGHLRRQSRQALGGDLPFNCCNVTRHNQRTRRRWLCRSASASTAPRQVIDLGTAHGHIAYDQGDARGAHWQPVDVAADLDDVEQHPLQGRGDRELADRATELTVGDRQT